MGAVVAGFLAIGLASAAACSTSSATPGVIGDMTGDGGLPGPYDATMGVTHRPEASTPPVEEAAVEEGGIIPCGDGGQQICAALCVDTRTDPNNCGGCQQHCSTGLTCSNGACVCGGDLNACGSQCVNFQNDPDNCGYCQHSCQSSVAGACSSGLCQSAVVAQAASSFTVAGIDVDSTNIYWTSPLNANDVPGSVSAKAFAGGTTFSILPAADYPAHASPFGVKVDLSHVFWTDETGTIWEEPIPLNGATFAYVWGNPDGGASTKVGSPVAIALDVNGGPNLYWVDTGLNTVNQASKDGGPITVLAQNRVVPHAITTDANYVYWVDLGAKTGADADGTVNAVLIGGGPTITLATGIDEPEGIAVDSMNVYFTSGANAHSEPQVPSVMSLPLGSDAGTAPTVLASAYGSARGIAVDSQYVYWTNYDDNTVVKTPINGMGTPYTVATAPDCNNPNAIVVLDNNIYWANEGDGTIRKVAK